MVNMTTLRIQSHHQGSKYLSMKKITPEEHGHHMEWKGGILDPLWNITGVIESLRQKLVENE